MSSTLTQSPHEHAGRRNTLSVAQVLLFYAIFLLLGWIVSWVLKLARLSALYDLVISDGIYGLLLLPIAYKFDSRIFSAAYWKISPDALVGVGVIAVSQFALDLGPALPPVSIYRAVAAILIAPFVEECARAVMICPLMERLGGPAGFAATVLLWAWPHDFFWVALVQQTILSFIFLMSRRSLPAAISAHIVMNVIALWHQGVSGW